MTNENQLTDLLLAAEYGLNLLEEKTRLENHCQLLTTELEEIRNQLKICQQIKFDQLLKIDQIESEYQKQQNDLLEEIRHYKQQIRIIQQENDNLIEENQRIEQIVEQNHHLQELNLELKSQLKQYKIDQEKLTEINRNLTNENITLREHNNKLSQYLIDYEQLKNENQFLQNNFEEQKRQFQSLKSIVGHLETDLRLEREEKFEAIENFDDEQLDFTPSHPQTNENLFSEIHQISAINEKVRILFQKIRDLFENQSVDEIDFDDTSKLLSHTIDLFEEYSASVKQDQSLPPLLNLSNDSKEYQDQIVKLHLLLITKQEQIETLRQILRLTKQSLVDTKAQYTNEKSILIQTIVKLNDARRQIQHQGKFISPETLQSSSS